MVELQKYLSSGNPKPPPARECFSCRSVPGIYRCTDCIRDHMSCLRCCIALHNMTPYHRIKRWNGVYFEGSDLGTLGLVMHVGHGGSECPSYSTSLSGQRHTGTGMDTEDTEDGWEDEVNLNQMDVGGDQWIGRDGQFRGSRHLGSGHSGNTPSSCGFIHRGFLVSDMLVPMPRSS
jgi:hypothetical protein